MKKLILLVSILFFVIGISFFLVKHYQLAEEPFTVLQTQEKSKSTLKEDDVLAIAKAEIKKEGLDLSCFRKVNAYYRTNNTWAVEFLDKADELTLDGGVTIIINESGKVEDFWLGSAQLHQ